MVAMELLSFLVFLHPVLTLPLLAMVAVGVFWLSFKNPEVGVYILFGELFLGSRGHLLEQNVGPIPMSFRLVIFVVVFIAWGLSRIKNQELRIKEDFRRIPKIYWFLILSVGFGIMNGIRQGNGETNVFLDANGYLYLAILPVVLDVIKTQARVNNLLQILAAAILVIAAKTLLLFVWFAYALPGVANLYHWVLDQDFGEITGILGSASRIFMQSQFYALMGLLIWGIGEAGEIKGKTRWVVVFSAILSIIISLSRSFWLGLFFGGIFSLAAMLFYLRIPLGNIFKQGAVIILIASLELGGLYALTQTAGGGFSESVASRGGNPVAEAASGARLLLLPELLSGISSSPVFGKGFGEVITYKSYLPDRITANNPDGEITNFAFEWGYLDTWLKIGAVGMLIYLLFIARIFREGWRVPGGPALGILSGIVALATLHLTTPYLNHPLGIGYLIFAFATFRVMKGQYATAS